MKLSFKEWMEIREILRVAEMEYIREMEGSTESDNENSFYQVFKRQAERARYFIERIENVKISYKRCTTITINKGDNTMFTRKEYESHFGIVSEEEWAIVQKIY